MYGKIFERVFTGSMFGAGPVVFSVWAYVIASARPPGTVELNPRLLAACIGTSHEEVREAIEYLCRPDEQSDNEEHEGRRLLHLRGFVYQVVSFEKYRRMRDSEERREYMRDYMRDYMRKRRTKESNNGLTDSNANACLADLAQAEAEAEAEAEKTLRRKESANVPVIAPQPAPDPPPEGDSPSGDGEHGSAPKKLNGNGYHPPDTPYGALVELYHRHLPTGARCELLTARRKEHMRARWRTVCSEGKLDQRAALSWFDDFFKHCSESKFLTGKTKPSDGRAPFRVSLDWLMQPERFAQVYEGRFHR